MPLPVRRSSRLIIREPSGAVLLFRYHDEHRAPFWASPGGELVGHESYDAAARRELLEETGRAFPIGRIVREREAVYAVARAQPARWLERYFLVDASERFEPTTERWTDEESETIRAWAWWSASELSRTSEVLLPEWLPELVAGLAGD